MWGGGGLRRILKNVIGLRIDEKVGNHCHNVSHLSGENLRPSCIVLVSIFFSTMVICLYNMSCPMGPPWIDRSSA